ncbi:hypothetical protein FBUS_06225 [Fasciolopsis buskii]|uniref:Uncharacterized protein n=1 Tax=Fasciolopsis buskii TaxID=27845 RepID=A0A8E0RZ54_9TREM|nr:hypothetical protein FBUS_06225 [Fasciolopsis buski]
MRKKLSVHVISSEKHGCNLRSLASGVKSDVIKDPKKFKESCTMSSLAKPYIPLEPKFPPESQPVAHRASGSFADDEEQNGGDEKKERNE